MSNYSPVIAFLGESGRHIGAFLAAWSQESPRPLVVFKAEKSKLLEQGFQIYHQESDSDRRFRSICQLGH
ncbi:MAG: hypothetical protein IM576_16675, partial [Pseudanabaena sp. M074S1SP2A07QC]|nr:hypothetical protein [Pseudanabaena sp. M074S1SP2A07QC]